MHYFTKESLLSNENDLGNVVELNLNNESSAIISEYGGRLLGFFPKNDNYIIGGDRYWISPEREFFYKNPQNWENWFCPQGLDPAYYDILVESTTSCTLSSPVTVESQIKKEFYNGEITRQLTLKKEPISTGLSYCGIEFVDDCVFFQSGLKINGWSLACVISGGPSNPGTVLIPTRDI